MASIFLSYNKGDSRFTRKLTDRLTKSGVFVWLDMRQVRVGDSLIERISNAIDRVDYVGAVISRRSVKSSWVKKELQIAITKEIEGKRVTVLPLLIDDCEIPSYLSDKMYADFRESHRFEKECEKLFDVLNFDRRHTQLLDNIGVSEEWTNDGPRILGNGIVISPLEWTALFNRYLEKFDKLCKDGTQADRARVEAVLRACEETYYTTIYEKDIRNIESEIGRKADLFFRHVMALWERSHTPRDPRSGSSRGK
jgi:hypothetical protein